MRCLNTIGVCLLVCGGRCVGVVDVRRGLVGLGPEALGLGAERIGVRVSSIFWSEATERSDLRVRSGAEVLYREID